MFLNCCTAGLLQAAGLSEHVIQPPLNLYICDWRLPAAARPSAAAAAAAALVSPAALAAAALASAPASASAAAAAPVLPPTLAAAALPPLARPPLAAGVAAAAPPPLSTVVATAAAAPPPAPPLAAAAPASAPPAPLTAAAFAAGAPAALPATATAAAALAATAAAAAFRLVARRRAAPVIQLGRARLAHPHFYERRLCLAPLCVFEHQFKRREPLPLAAAAGAAEELALAGGDLRLGAPAQADLLLFEPVYMCWCGLNKRTAALSKNGRQAYRLCS